MDKEYLNNLIQEQESLYKKQYEAIKAALDENDRLFVTDPEKWNDDNISEYEILDGCEWCWINIDTFTGTEDVKCVGGERIWSDQRHYYRIYYVPDFGGLEDTDLSNVSRGNLTDIIEMFNSININRNA